MTGESLPEVTGESRSPEPLRVGDFCEIIQEPEYVWVRSIEDGYVTAEDDRGQVYPYMASVLRLVSHHEPAEPSAPSESR